MTILHALLITTAAIVSTPFASGILLAGFACALVLLYKICAQNDSDLTRLGLHEGSNLDNVVCDTTQPMNADQARVQALFVYPVKSCKGIELLRSEVLGNGLKLDRLFSFALRDERTQRWRIITQREVPKLALLETELWIPRRPCRGNVSTLSMFSTLSTFSTRGMASWSANGGCLLVRFPYVSPSSRRSETVEFKIPISPNPARMKAMGYQSEPLSIWKDRPIAWNVTREISERTLQKLKTFLDPHDRRLGQLALFRVDESSLRTVTRSLPVGVSRSDSPFRVGLADAFPIHLLNMSSVRAVSDAQHAGTNTATSLDARRFRANIYISGVPAFTEDSWKRIRLVDSVSHTHDGGEPENYHVACRTARCKVPDVDQVTGIIESSQPSVTLRQIRVVDEGAKPHAVLGLSIVPLFDSGSVRIGDRVEVLDTGVHVYEKMFQ